MFCLKDTKSLMQQTPLAARGHHVKRKRSNDNFFEVGDHSGGCFWLSTITHSCRVVKENC